MSSQYHHVPVFADEVIALLQPRSNQNFIDATVGGGGHAERILALTGPEGVLIGLDLDPEALHAARERLTAFGKRAVLLKVNYADIEKILSSLEARPRISGCILDLGISSPQLDTSGRGFSFRDTGRLDMRFDTDAGEDASQLLMTTSEEELSTMLRQFGEVRGARRIAREIIAIRDEAKARGRDVIDVQDIVTVAARIAPKTRRTHTHPATQVFQALRIAVNRELDNLRLFLPQIVSVLEPGGRIAVIAYHSLEDRIVKQFFRIESRDCLCPREIPVCRCGHQRTVRRVTEHAVAVSDAERGGNPRSRSAHLRVAEKI
ncbi:MAG: 16S rRNA (cytosine(1402)-N(4))-methyltransferase RsmH [Patescibacteria group bacterium]